MGKMIPAEKFLNKKYNHLTIIEDLGLNLNDKLRRRQVKCLCDCGNDSVIKYLVEIMRNHVKSCGCLNHTGKHLITHGMTKTREYRIWRNIKTRCFNKNISHAHIYSEKGITICPEWENSFEQFYKDMGPCPSNLHSIDRINNDGNYEPSNCRWATIQEQGQNTSRTIFNEQLVKEIREHFQNGKSRKELAEMYNCKQSTINGIIANKTWKNI